MAWTNPVNPVSGTVITVAYATVNILDPIRWLRLMTGNADPPGTGYVVGSDTTGSTSWKTVPTVLGYAPVNQAGDVMRGDLTVSRQTSGSPTVGVLFLGQMANTVYLAYSGTGGEIQLVGAPVHVFGALVVGGAVTVANTLEVNRGTGAVDSGLWSRAGITAHTVDNSRPAVAFRRDGVGASALYLEGGVTLRLIDQGGNDALLWNSLNDGAGSGLDADVLDGQQGSFYQARANHTGLQAPSTISPQGVGSTLHADLLDGAHASAVPTPNAIPVADPSGHLDAWVTPSGLAGVPAGLVCGFAGTPAAIPTGWVRYTAGDGRLLVGAGTVGENTFTENNSYGSSWAHQHVGNSFPFSTVLSGGSALTVSGTATGTITTGGPSAAGGTASGTPPPSFADGAHTHTASSVSLGVGGAATGTINGNATGASSFTTLLLPMRAIVWISKT